MTDTSHRVDVFEDKGGEFRWRRVALRGNLDDEIVSDGAEGYSRRSDAEEAARRENPDVAVVWHESG